MADQPAALSPTRDPQVTLPDLIEVLLNKGVYLNLDLIISVADIPLIGVNLRATIAGMETMLEYGMMRNWDERTRAWVRNSVARHLPLAKDEDVVARMAGGHLDVTDPFRVDMPDSRIDPPDDGNTPDPGDPERGIWRPGTLYLTTHRLIAYRRDPSEILWQAPLTQIEAVDVRPQRSIGGEERGRLQIRSTDGSRTMLSASEPERLRDLLTEAADLPPGESRGSDDDAARRPAPSEPEYLAQARMWLREMRVSDPVWRGGTGTFDLDRGLTWKGPLDSRPALRLTPAQIEEVELAEGHSPLRGTPILVVRSGSTETHLATDHPDRWARLIRHVQQASPPAHEPRGVPDAPVPAAEVSR